MVEPRQPDRFPCPRCELRIEDCPAKRIFDCLSPPQEAELARHRVARRYDAGVQVIHHDTPALAVLTVHAGRVRLVRPLTAGATALAGIRGPGELIGVKEILGGVPYQNTVETLEPSVLCAVPRAAIRKALGDCPELAFRLMKWLARHHLIARDQLVVRNHLSAASRLARLIQSLDSSGGGCDFKPWSVEMDTAEMAVLVGTSEVELSSVLDGLVAQRAIEMTNGSITVLDVETLESSVQ